MATWSLVVPALAALLAAAQSADRTLPSSNGEVVVHVDPSVATSPANDPSRVATIEQALARIRELRRRDPTPLHAHAVVELAPGRHWLDHTLVITPEVSDTEIRGPKEHTATVSGGRRIEGWRASEWNGKPAWVADVADAKNGAWPFRELFVNGERRTRARHPNRGHLAVAGLDPADAGRPWNEGVSKFTIAPHDLDLLKSAPPRLDGTLADVTVMCRWVESHVRVSTVDLEKNSVALRDPTVFKLDPGDLWYADGSPAFLDEPGEWWLDEKEGRVWCLPTAGETLAKFEAIAPRLERLVSIDGGPRGPLDQPKPIVDHVQFHDVVFAHSEWWFASPATADGARASGFPQAAVGVPAAIEITNATNCGLGQCVVEHVGTYAVLLGEGCVDGSVWKCRLCDLGGGGVKIGTTALPTEAGWASRRNHVDSSEIGDAGRLFHSAVGIWIGQSSDNAVYANEVHDLYYTGISVGWTWGYGPANAFGNDVVSNHVHHVGKLANGDGPILSDMGGVYTLGNQTGTRIVDNWFHDVAALRYGGWGIYLDEGTTGIEVSSNLVVNTTHGGFHQHYGKDNVVENNVFAFGRDAQIQRSRREPHTSFTFRNNVVVFDRGSLFAGDLSDGHFAFEHNLYWRSDGKPIDFAGRTFEQWRAAGFDRDSVVEDPKLALPVVAPLELATDSPASRTLARTVVGLRPKER